MQRQLERSLAHAQERRQFGQPIGSFQAVSHKLVDMKLRLETARLLLYKLGWLIDRDQKTPALESALVKLYLSECFVRSSLDALQVHGGYGYMTEYELERDVRDAIGSKLYSGTSELQYERRREEHGPVTRLVHDLLRDSAAAHPENVAVVDGERTITYAELEAQSNRLAHLLREAGVARGDRVGLYLDKSLEAVLGIYGILKAGATYVPLDPAAPPARLAVIAANADLRVVITRAEKAELWPQLVDEGAPVETFVELSKPGLLDEHAGHAGSSSRATTPTSPTSSTRRGRRACRRA